MDLLHVVPTIDGLVTTVLVEGPTQHLIVYRVGLELAEGVQLGGADWVGLGLGLLVGFGVFSTASEVASFSFAHPHLVVRVGAVVPRLHCYLRKFYS